MASVAMLSPSIKKEANVLAAPCLFQKRKPVVSSVATRARFVKPRPNVSVNKTSKESSSLPSENTKIDDVPSQPVETEPEPLEKPAEPKRAPIPALSRARFQRAKPNIGSLMNKSAKKSSEDKSVPSSDDAKMQEAVDSKLDVSNTSKTESTAEEKCKSDCKSPPIAGSLNMEKVVDMPYSVAESQHSPEPTIELDSACSNAQEFSSIRTIPGDKALESHAEESSNSDVPMTEPANEISDDTEGSLTSPRSFSQATPEKESPAVVNKSIEYPTLKSILNSPRKRTTTKKVHERRKRVANFSSTPSRSEMTMVDLIYWNPSSSPMKEVKPVTPAEEDLLPVDDPPPPPPTEETESCSIGPKVIINDDGEIILDESSLFVRRKDTVDHSAAPVIENDNTTYSSFRNRSFRTWSKGETAKFYKALSLVGTDFALMEGIFKEDGKVTRSRRELKLKFKREEKSNPKFVHTAIYELQTYDLNILDEDHDIALLDESEMIDDAPKQVKKPAASGTKAPGKRGRKKKSELTEVSNRNASESLPVAEEESREASNSMCSVDLQGNKDKEIDSNSQPATLRPGRARKAKILSDYITDVDDLSDANDFEEETLPIKKRKRAQVLSEEEDGATEVIDSKGSIVNDDNLPQAISSIEEIYPCIADERNDPETETNSGTVPIKKRRKFQTLPKINEENDKIANPVSELLETSRSGRKIKAKNMSDFVTDPDALCDSDDDMNSGEQVQDLEEVNIISSEENAENLKAVESASQLSISTQPEEEFSIIPSSEADGEYPSEQNVICTLDVENSTGNNPIIEASDTMDQNVLDNSELISMTEIVPSSTEVVPTTISSDKPRTDNLIQLPDCETCTNVNASNILIDPAITEIVVTSDQMPRRTRRKALPNVVKGSKRPPIQRKPLPLPRRTSFTSFTPVEEVPQIDNKLSFVQSSKTYSRQAFSKLIESQDRDVTELEYLETVPELEYLETVPELEYLETVQKSPVNIARKRSLSGPAKSPSTQEMNVSRTNSICSPIRSPLSNASLNVPSFKSESTTTVPHSSTELPLHALTADPKTINMNPENSSDSVVILTRTPNNSNMLHLFVYQKS